MESNDSFPYADKFDFNEEKKILIYSYEDSIFVYNVEKKVFDNKFFVGSYDILGLKPSFSHNQIILNTNYPGNKNQFLDIELHYSDNKLDNNLILDIDDGSLKIIKDSILNFITKGNIEFDYEHLPYDTLKKIFHLYKSFLTELDEDSIYRIELINKNYSAIFKNTVNAILYYNSNLKIYNLISREEILDFKSINATYSPKFNLNGEYLLLSTIENNENIVRLWLIKKSNDIYKKEKIKDFNGTYGLFLKDDKYLAIINQNGCDIYNFPSLNYISSLKHDDIFKIINTDEDIFITLNKNSFKIFRKENKVFKQINIAFAKDEFTDIIFQKNINKIITTSNNEIQIWDLQGNELLSIYKIGDFDWVHLSPNKFFDGSNNAFKKMYYVTRIETIELEQLKHRHWIPNLYYNVLNNFKFNNNLNFNDILLFPKINLNISNDTLEINLNKRNGGIGKVQVFVDYLEIISDATTFKNLDTALSNITIKINLLNYSKFLLDDTTNILKVIAFNNDNSISSSPHYIEYKPSIASRGQIFKHSSKHHTFVNSNNTESLLQPDFYSLIVGVSDYNEHPNYKSIDLKYSAKDAIDIENALRIGSSNLFKNTYINLLTTESKNKDSFPTKHNIIKILNKFADSLNGAKINDIVVIYLSGHGISINSPDNDFYFLTSSAVSTDERYLKDKIVQARDLISGKEFVEFLNKIPSQKKVMIIDACASGKAIETFSIAMKNITGDLKRAWDRMKDRTGFYILAGCASDAVSYETSVYGQGILTYSLLKGIKGDKLRRDSLSYYIDIEPLFSYVVEEVPKLAKDIGGIQKPFFTKPNNARSFDIGMLKNEDKMKIILSEPKPIFTPVKFVKLSGEKRVNFDNIINARLNYLSQKGKYSELVFTESVNYPNAFSVEGLYSINDNIIDISFEIIRNNKTVLDKIILKENISKIDFLIDNIIDKIKEFALTIK